MYLVQIRGAYCRVLLSLNHILLYFVFVVKLKSTAVKSNYASVENEATIINLGNERDNGLVEYGQNLSVSVNWTSRHEINYRHPKNFNVRFAYRDFVLSEILEIKQKVDYIIEKLSDPEIKRTNYSNDATKSATQQHHLKLALELLKQQLPKCDTTSP